MALFWCLYYYARRYRDLVTAMGLEFTTTQFVNEHSTIGQTGQLGQMVE